MMLGFATSMFVLWQKLVSDVWVHRNPMFLLAILFTLVGVQFLGIGLVAEIMVRTYFESQQKTAYSISETKNLTPEASPAASVAS